MSRLAWHPRYHRDALDGMELMCLEDRGAYTTLLDMMYDRGGPVPDEDRMLAGKMLVSTRTWRTIRARLIDAGKVEVIDTPNGPFLFNERARNELETQEKRSRKNAESGAKGGRKKAVYPPKVNGNNDNDEATALAKSKLETVQNSSVDKSTGADSAVVDHDKAAWADAVGVLSGQGGMTEPAARKFFGQLLARNKIEARDLLAALTTIRVNGTLDPQGLLTRHAQAIARRRTDEKPKRVGWV